MREQRWQAVLAVILEKISVSDLQVENEQITCSPQLNAVGQQYFNKDGKNKSARLSSWVVAASVSLPVVWESSGWSTSPHTGSDQPLSFRLSQWAQAGILWRWVV